MAAGLLVFCARDEGDPLGVEVSPSARAADVLEQAAARDPHLEGAELHFQGRRVGRDELLSDAGISAEATVQLVPSCFRRLPEELRRGLAEQEVELPTATIRALLTPPAADAASVLLQTARGRAPVYSYAVSVLNGIDWSAPPNRVQALVLGPTREWIHGIAVLLNSVGRYLTKDGRCCVPVTGGTPVRQQLEEIGQCGRLWLGTPGRTLDLFTRFTEQSSSAAITFDLEIRQIVLDDVDRLLELGFGPQLESILERVQAPGVRRLFCGSTVDNMVLNFASVRAPGEVLQLNEADLNAGA
eukprot:TRINITY_DN26155_c0_g1_i2.p1 TRINITY_DN26155_c0_g1~~TRINITY_DN26155_c0_g1_i2.p1  ORF type:complete len:300 (+),score=63.98 TRINITY_DN26155_c0_g1_i2:63-962(+)